MGLAVGTLGLAPHGFSVPHWAPPCFCIWAPCGLNPLSHHHTATIGVCAENLPYSAVGSPTAQISSTFGQNHASTECVETDSTEVCRGTRVQRPASSIQTPRVPLGSGLPVQCCWRSLCFRPGVFTLLTWENVREVYVPVPIQKNAANQSCRRTTPTDKTSLETTQRCRRCRNRETAGGTQVQSTGCSVIAGSS